MRRRRGAALPAAVMLCSFLLIISFGVASLVITSVSINKVSSVQRAQRIAFLQSHEQYYEYMDIEYITDKSLVYKVYEKEDDADIKALVAYVTQDSTDPRFYAIYDFNDVNDKKVLAYQTSDLYITTVGGHQYVGGLVKIGD